MEIAKCPSLDGVEELVDVSVDIFIFRMILSFSLSDIALSGNQYHLTLSESVSGQNWFCNTNTKMLFAFSLFSHKHTVEISTSYMTCVDTVL